MYLRPVISDPRSISRRAETPNPTSRSASKYLEVTLISSKCLEVCRSTSVSYPRSRSRRAETPSPTSRGRSSAHGPLDFLEIFTCHMQISNTNYHKYKYQYRIQISNTNYHIYKYRIQISNTNTKSIANYDKYKYRIQISQIHQNI